MDPAYTFKPIGILHSCYGEKFGIPRQPGIVNSAIATLELLTPYNTPDAVRGLDGFSHLWVLFLFHQSAREQWKATVRPPRLGGNKRVGIFATRSNFRPNPIGLSVVEIQQIQTENDGVTITLRGGDFLDGTPVLDIKPYIPYADSLPLAQDGFATGAPLPENRVQFSDEADASCRASENEQRPALRQLITDLLSYNPRPAYQSEDPKRCYGTRLFDLNIRWTQTNGLVIVQSIEAEPENLRR